MNNNLKKEIILTHYENPTNKGLINDNNYKKININSDSCIDEIELMVKLNNDIIEDIRFDGEACAICTSSTSIMIETLIGKTVNEAKIIIDNFYDMIEEKSYNKELIEQAIVYEDISKQPNRKKCALLSWNGIEKIIK